MHILASEQLGIPKSIKEAFQILEQNGYIDRGLSDRLQKMVGFRNIAMHDYRALDLNILRSVVAKHLEDLQAFYQMIIKKTK